MYKDMHGGKGMKLTIIGGGPGGYIAANQSGTAWRRGDAD